MLTLLNINDGSTQGNIVGAGPGSINSLTYINSTVFAGGSSDKKVYFWSTNFVPLYTMSTTHSSSIEAIVLAAPNILITASGDWTAKAFNLSNNYQELSTYSHTTGISGLLLLSNGNLATWGGQLLRIWTWQTGTTIASITVNPGYSVYSASQVSGELIATGDQINTIRLWYINNGTLFKQVGTMSSVVSGLLGFPDGFKLIASDYNANVKFWNWQNSTAYYSGGQAGLSGYETKFFLTTVNKVLAVSSSTVKYFGISSTNSWSPIWNVTLSSTTAVLAMNTLINGNLFIHSLNVY